MDPEIVFFLVAAIIALISKLVERSKSIRAKSLREQAKREKRERLELIRVGAEVAEAPPPPPSPQLVPVRRR